MENKRKELVNKSLLQASQVQPNDEVKFNTQEVKSVGELWISKSPFKYFAEKQEEY
jgi:hypothetical protein